MDEVSEDARVFWCAQLRGVFTSGFYVWVDDSYMASLNRVPGHGLGELRTPRPESNESYPVSRDATCCDELSEVTLGTFCIATSIGLCIP